MYKDIIEHRPPGSDAASSWQRGSNKRPRLDSQLVDGASEDAAVVMRLQRHGSAYRIRRAPDR